MSEKQAALDELRAELDRWQRLLAGMGEAQIIDPQLDEGWSVKDVVAHLWAWQQRSVARVEAALRGGEPEYPAWPDAFDIEQEGQPHDLNAWLYASTRGLPWAEVYQRWEAGFRRLLELGAAVADADMVALDRYPWIAGYALIDVLRGSAEHHREHAEYLGA